MLEIDSESLVDFSLVERRRRLEDVVDPSVGGVVVSPRFEDGQALLAATKEEGLEGVVAKRKDSRSLSGNVGPSGGR